MSIHIRCPECGAEGRVKNERAGTVVQCNECSKPVRVPADAPQTSSRKKRKAESASPATPKLGDGARKHSTLDDRALPEQAFDESYLAPSKREQVRTGVGAYLRDRRLWALVAVVLVLAVGLWIADWYTAYRDLVQRAEVDREPMAAFQLARFYESGVMADPKHAFELYTFAAAKNHRPAQFTLAQIYEYGTLAPADGEQAVYWYTRGANQGSDDCINALRRLGQRGSLGAQLALGELYTGTPNTPADLTEAMEWYRRAADNGSVEAQFLVGQRYALGQGVEQNWTEAASWYERAAKGGDVRAQYALAQLFLDGTGVDADRAAALAWFAKAADGGHIPSALKAAKLNYLVDEEDRDLDAAVRYLTQAADSDQPGRVEAAYYLGGLYFNGEGVDTDYRKADYYFRLAGGGGHARAQYCLGVMLVNKERLNPPDYLSPHFAEAQTASYWLERSAETGGWETPSVFPADNGDYEFLPEYGLVLRDAKERRNYQPPGA